MNGLNALGIGPRDMITILQAVKAAGALQAEIEGDVMGFDIPDRSILRPDRQYTHARRQGATRGSAQLQGSDGQRGRSGASRRNSRPSSSPR